MASPHQPPLALDVRRSGRHRSRRRTDGLASADGPACPCFYLLGDPAALASRAKRLELDVPITEVEPAEAYRTFAQALPVVPLAARSADDTRQAGRSQRPAGILESIDRAVADAFDGRASAVVTCPIAKKVLYDGGFRFPGHTEYLAELANIRHRRHGASGDDAGGAGSSAPCR